MIRYVIRERKWWDSLWKAINADSEVTLKLTEVFGELSCEFKEWRSKLLLPNNLIPIASVEQERKANRFVVYEQGCWKSRTGFSNIMTTWVVFDGEKISLP